MPPVEIPDDLLAALTPSLARAALPGWIASHVEAPAAAVEALTADLGALLQELDDDAIAGALAAFAACGADYALYDAHPVGRRVSRLHMGALLRGGGLVGGEHLAAVACQPTLVLCNHLSYVDTQATDALLAAAGASAFADALVTIAGPKVYATPFRRFAAFCLNTRKTAQSTQVAHNEAGLSPREVARIAIDTIHSAQALMAAGRPVLLYGEGSRSRDGRLQPFLRGASKYARPGETLLLPMAITGSDAIFPVDAQTMRPAAVTLSIGAPIPVPPGDRGEALAAAWRCIAGLLDADHQPLPGLSPLG